MVVLPFASAFMDESRLTELEGPQASRGVLLLSKERGSQLKFI